MAYRVGLLAAITRPSALRSRTRSPRVTLAMRRREASNERAPDSQPDATQPPSASTAAVAVVAMAIRRRRAGRKGVAMAWSWPEVSRMPRWGSMRASLAEVSMGSLQ